jgi:hypothetical protein
MKERKWKIYYGDGSTYSSSDGSPFDAPAHNVQIISMERDDGSAPPTWGHDLYRWDGKRWVGCNWQDLGQYFAFHKGPQKVLMGYEMHDRNDCLKILERAIREGVN